MRQDFVLPTEEGHQLSCSLYSKVKFGEQPCVIYAHGFKGFKDWAFVPHVAHRFAEAGISFLCFNFSHNGIGKDGESFTEVEKFSQNTFSLEVSELQQVIKRSCHAEFFGGKARSGLGLVGHSRGGGVALIAGARQAEVQAVATWAGVSTFDRYSKAQMQEWEKKGYMEVVNSRTGQVLQMGSGILKDIQKKGKKDLHVLSAVKELNKPLLVLHGGDDVTVPPYEAEQIAIFGDKKLTRMRLIPKTAHTFGAVHPFKGSTEALDIVVGQSIDFFKENLY